MGKRRLGGLWFVGFVVCACVTAGGGGCAQGGGGASKKMEGDARAEGAEDLLARSAAGMDRVLKGEQKAQPLGIRADDEGQIGERVVVSEPAATEGAARPSRVVWPKQERAVVDGGVVAVSGEGGGAQGEAAKADGVVLSGWWSSGVVDAADGAAGSGSGAPALAAASGNGASASAFWKSEDVQQGSGGFRISGLALCSRVEGFGKFVKVESVRGGGRAVPLLVYTQVDGFSYRTRDGSAAGVDDGKTDWVVELGQSVVVYRMGADGKGDVQVKVEPEQTARDVATFKRRDHYLVQRIELPTPLVVGKYVVKVTLRDKATGMADERTAEVVVR